MNREYLEKLGFVGFTFGEKSKRDGIERVTWSNLLENGDIITIRLKLVNEVWQIDLYKKCNTKDEKPLLEISIDEVVNIVKKYGVNTFDTI